MKIIFSLFLLLACTHHPAEMQNPQELNDIHSQLNASVQSQVLRPTSILAIQEIIRLAQKKGQAVSISGGKHSMGGQQFGQGSVHINMSHFNQVLDLDEKQGIVEVESGIQWPELVEWLLTHQEHHSQKWGIRQKQTGADRLSIGGALSSNIHGRGLKMKPMVGDVESFTLIDANGDIKNCSRSENAELFSLAIGGYGLFGVIATVKLRLAPVQTLERVVKLLEVKDFVKLADKRAQEGFLFGDLQFAIDPASKDFLRKGIYSLYRPVKKTIPSTHKRELKREDWLKLLGLAHANKTLAFELYSQFYLSSHRQLYSSDTHQMGIYIDNYHQLMDPSHPASEMISEVYVPRSQLEKFMSQLRQDFREQQVDVIYGTIRLIEKDQETFLPWAKENYACLVFNFHVDHSSSGIEKAEKDFRLLIDRALELGGSYFLTYHRWARKDQVLKAYPQFVDFLRLKQKYDPKQVFQSDWYRHYLHMFAQELQ